jgi:asparagine synthase (glutamine-hydrolysing)
MFAFAIWDTRTRRLLLARDRLGIKPLFYYQNDDLLLFGSEPKALLEHPSVQPVVTLDGLRQIFAGIRTPGSSIWYGINELRPGTYLSVRSSGLCETTYWKLEAVDHHDDVPTSVATLRHLLSDVVRRQLIADVPTCVLLSGGLDSSAIAAIAATTAKLAEQPLRTFALDVVGADRTFVADPLRGTLDAPFAQAAADHLGSVHTCVLVDPVDAVHPAVRTDTVKARDTPGFGDTDQSLYLLFKAVREHAIVALSGEGADEICGGYREFHDQRPVGPPTFPWLGGIVSHARLRANVWHESLNKLLDTDTYIADNYQTAIAAAPTTTKNDAMDERARLRSYLYLTYFLPLLLERKDRMSMAMGLEVRVPFCDHRIVEYLFNTPWSMKILDGRNKGLLRAAVSDMLPASIVNREKSVYPCIHDLTYLEALQTQARHLLDDPHCDLFEVVNRRAIQEATLVPVSRVRTYHRLTLERALEFNSWLEVRRPVFRFT